MKKLTIATAIAAAALFTPIGVGVSVPSTVATAHAYTADEQAYLLTLRDRSSIKGSDDYLIRLGRKVCELKADGSPHGSPHGTPQGPPHGHSPPEISSAPPATPRSTTTC